MISPLSTARSGSSSARSLSGIDLETVESTADVDKAPTSRNQRIGATYKGKKGKGVVITKSAAAQASQKEGKDKEGPSHLRPRPPPEFIKSKNFHLSTDIWPSPKKKASKSKTAEEKVNDKAADETFVDTHILCGFQPQEQAEGLEESVTPRPVGRERHPGVANLYRNGRQLTSFLMPCLACASSYGVFVVDGQGDVFFGDDQINSGFTQAVSIAANGGDWWVLNKQGVLYKNGIPVPRGGFHDGFFSSELGTSSAAINSPMFASRAASRPTERVVYKRKYKPAALAVSKENFFILSSNGALYKNDEKQQRMGPFGGRAMIAVGNEGHNGASDVVFVLDHRGQLFRNGKKLENFAFDKQGSEDAEVNAVALSVTGVEYRVLLSDGRVLMAGGKEDQIGSISLESSNGQLVPLTLSVNVLDVSTGVDDADVANAKKTWLEAAKKGSSK